MAFSYNDLKRSAAKLRFSDPSKLKAAGLSKLTRVYEVYPLTEDNIDRCFLIPTGTSPKEIQNYDEFTAASKVIVLEQSDGSWKKCYPSNSPPEPPNNPPPDPPPRAEMIEAAPPEDEFEIIEED